MKKKRNPSRTLEIDEFVRVCHEIAEELSSGAQLEVGPVSERLGVPESFLVATCLLWSAALTGKEFVVVPVVREEETMQ